jgi:superfamily II DNA or RNA helicase
MTNIEVRKNRVKLVVDGRGLIRKIFNNVSSSKRKKLFIKISDSYIFNEVTMEFYDLFALEVYALLRWIVEDEQESRYNINVREIEKALELLAKRTWVKNIFSDTEVVDTLDYDAIKKNMKFSILEHQIEAFKYYSKSKQNLDYRGGMLDMAVGSGKTFTSLAITEAIHADYVIVICPLPTLYQVWEDSITNTLFTKPRSCCIVKDDKYRDEKYILAHYEAMSKLPDIISSLNGKISFIVDESHHFADPKSDRTKLLKEVLDESGSDDIILMSGTPIKATAAEVMNIMEILDKRFVGPAKERFKALYKGMGSLLKHTLSIRYKAYTVKISKDEFDIPPLTTTQLNVKLKDPEPFLLVTIREEVKRYAKERMQYFKKHKKEYEDTYLEFYVKARDRALREGGTTKEQVGIYEKDVASIVAAYKANNLGSKSDEIERANLYERKVLQPMLDGTDKIKFKEAKTVYKYPALKIQGETLANVIGKAREQCHYSMAREFSFREVIDTTTRKTIVYSKYIEVCDATKYKVEKEKYSPVCIYGETMKDLHKLVDEFKEDESINPLITTYKALSTGVPLIEANIILAIDLPYMSYELEQTLARINRIGQKHPCHFYFLSLDTNGEPNINNRNIDINKLNNEAVSEITGYKNQTVLEDAEVKKSKLAVDNLLRNAIKIDTFLSGRNFI